MGYRVISEPESGYGRSDLIVLDPGRNRSLVLELKHVDEEKKMLEALGEACSQLIREKYTGRRAPAVQR
ncbi:MAG: PD-(D/E)XK nuclease domain-containing protein [bacterium]